MWIIIFCVAFASWRLWLSSGTRIDPFVNFDVLMYWLPLLREAAAQWRSATVPLWNPYQALGTPLLATQQVGVGYPLNFLYLILDGGTAWLPTATLHLIIAALGMYVFCRRLELTPSAALVGAATYAFSAVVIEKLVDLPDELICVAWLPAMFACAEALLAAPTIRASLSLGCVWALQILGGDADTITRSALLLAAYVALRMASQARRDRFDTLASGTAAGAALILALALTSFQLLPTLELVVRSVRAPGSLSAVQQVGLSADPWMLFSRRVRGIPTLSIGSGLPLILGLVGLLLWSRRREAWFFGIAAALLAFLSAGEATPLFQLFRLLPTESWFRGPMRFLNLWPLCVAPLAAAGAEELLRREPVSERQRRLWIGVASAAVVFAAQAAVASRSDTPRVWVVAAMFDLLPALLVGAAVVFRCRYHAWPATALVHLAIATMIWMTPALLYQPDTLSPYHVAAVYRPYAPAFEDLRRELPARALSLLRVADGRTVAKVGTYFRVPVVDDFEPLSLQSFRSFAEALRGGSSEPESLESLMGTFRGEVAPPRGRFDSRLLNLAGVRFVVLQPADETELQRWFGAEARLRLRARLPAAVVYENPDALPRAFVVASGRVQRVPADCIEALRAPGFDPSRDLLLDAPPQGPTPATADPHYSASILRYLPSYIEINVVSGQSGFLVLSDAHYPGWGATVDGVGTPVLRADCFFRAVPIAAGTHTVVLRYAPQSFRLGASISLAALVMSALLWYATGQTRRAGFRTEGAQSHDIRIEGAPPFPMHEIHARNENG